MILSPVPTLRRKKGTEKLAPIICAHAEAKEGAQAGARQVYGSPTLRAMHPIHKCVAKDAPHLLAALRNEPRYS